MGKPIYREERKRQILAVAAMLFANRTYSRTSLQDIASRLRFRKQSLYYFFGKKEDILYEILIAAISQVVEWLKRITESPAGPVEKLRNVIAMHAYEFHANESITKLYSQEKWDVLRPSRRRELKTLERQYDDMLQGILREGIDDGLFRADMDVKITAFAMVGMLFHMSRWYSPEGRLSVEEVVNNFVNVVFNGVLSSEREARLQPGLLDAAPGWLSRVKNNLDTLHHEGATKKAGTRIVKARA